MNFGEGQTLSLEDMNKLINTAQRRVNELKNTLHKVQHNRDMEPLNHTRAAHAKSLKEALDTLRSQRNTIVEVECHIHNAVQEKEACRKADNNPKFAEEFQAIVRELNLHNLFMQHEAEDDKVDVPVRKSRMKWYERLYAWVMSH
ncbi:MAG: hypothetical protein WC052_05975 [Patescibacteria group bacterium]